MLALRGGEVIREDRILPWAFRPSCGQVLDEGDLFRTKLLQGGFGGLRPQVECELLREMDRSHPCPHSLQSETK